MDRKTVALALLVFAAVAGIAHSAVTTYPVTQGATWQTDDELTVQWGSDIELQTGNPFNNDDSMTVRNVTFYSESDANVTIEDLNGTRLTDIKTFGGWLTVNNSDDLAKNVSVKGTPDRLEIYNQSIDRDEPNSDLFYDAPSSYKLRVRNTSLGTDETLLAVDRSSGTVIDSGQAFANGTVEFSDMDSGARTVDLQKGASALSVFNESQPSQLVDDKATLRIRFFGSGDDVVQKTVTDGTVGLSGVPQDEEIVVTVKEDESNFTYRRIILESVFQQEEIYLLHQNQPSIEVDFQLADKTGRFPASESRLFVEKPITKDFDGDNSDETKYQVIVGDRFGADGSFPATLQPDERYRLRVENSQGDTRILGAYSAATGGVEEVPIGDFREGGRILNETSFNAVWNETDGQRAVRVFYQDPKNATRELDIEIIGTSPGASDLQPNTTVQGYFGRYAATYPVPASDPDNATYRVRYHAERDGVADKGGTQYVGNVPNILGGLGVDPQVLTLLSWVGLVAMTGGVVLIDDRLAAFVAVAIAAALTALGPLSIPSLALGMAGAMAVLWNVARVRL